MSDELEINEPTEEAKEEVKPDLKPSEKLPLEKTSTDDIVNFMSNDFWAKVISDSQDSVVSFIELNGHKWKFHATRNPNQDYEWNIRLAREKE